MAMGSVYMALMDGLFVGIGTALVILVILEFIFAKQEAATLSSDSAARCEGSVTWASVDNNGPEGSTRYFLGYKFHVPASADQIVGAFGAMVTGKLAVSEAKYDVHCVGLPKACTVRYVTAKPRVNRLIATCDDETPDHGGPDAPRKLYQWAFYLIFAVVFLALSLQFSQTQKLHGPLKKWPKMAQGVIFAVVVVIAVLAFVGRVRIKMRLQPFPCMPGCCERYKDFAIPKLDAPYQSPEAVPRQANRV